VRSSTLSSSDGRTAGGGEICWSEADAADLGVAPSVRIPLGPLLPIVAALPGEARVSVGKGIEVEVEIEFGHRFRRRVVPRQTLLCGDGMRGSVVDGGDLVVGDRSASVATAGVDAVQRGVSTVTSSAV